MIDVASSTLIPDASAMHMNATEHGRINFKNARLSALTVLQDTFAVKPGFDCGTQLPRVVDPWTETSLGEQPTNPDIHV